MLQTIETLILKMTNYSTEDIVLVRKAYEFAKNTHDGQMRVSGQPYLSHPLGVAHLIVEMNMPARIITAALLHDVLEDTSLPQQQVYKELRDTFDSDMARLVERVTKLSRVRYRGMERYLENLRKMFIAMAEDLRVVVLKFADRLHNLQDLNVLPKHKAQRVAIETIELYAPIAKRLGMGELTGQLEDAAFPHAYPKEYEWLKNLIKGKYEEKERHLQKAKKQAQETLISYDVGYLDISGRTKNFYSLYQKLLRYNRNLLKIYDLVALRIIVQDVPDCYAALGALHSRFAPLKGRIKDYIAQPKPNGYRSLHTTVFDDDGEIVEFQIRTKEMHDESEYGIAAHWRYSETGKKKNAKNQQAKWMTELARVQKDLSDRKMLLETLEELKIDIFQNRIFVSTPRGDIIDLPEDSTPIDFAYAVHSDLGNHCIGAQINDEPAPLDTKLKSSDVVRIIADPKRRSPSSDWLKFVKTRQAKERIKAAQKTNFTKWFVNKLPQKKKKA